MNTTPPALALSHVPPSQTASEHTDHGPDTRGRASLRALSLVRAALERVQGVSRVRHHRTGEWTVDVRVLDPRATCDEIAYRVQGARLALRETVPGVALRVLVVTELVARWRAERLFRAVVVVRKEVPKTSPREGGIAPAPDGGLLSAGRS